MRSCYTRVVVLAFLFCALSFYCAADTIRISGQLYEDVLIQESQNSYDVLLPKTGEMMTVSKQRTDFDQVHISDDPVERKRLRDAWRETRDAAGKGPKGGWPEDQKARDSELQNRLEELRHKQDAWEADAREEREKQRIKQQADIAAVQERERLKASREADAAAAARQEYDQRYKQWESYDKIRRFFSAFWPVLIGAGIGLFVTFLGVKSASGLTLCKACGQSVSKEAPTCPHCGHPLKDALMHQSLSDIIFTIIGLIMFGLVLLFFGE